MIFPPGYLGRNSTLLTLWFLTLWAQQYLVNSSKGSKVVLFYAAEFVGIRTTGNKHHKAAVVLREVSKVLKLLLLCSSLCNARKHWKQSLWYWFLHPVYTMILQKTQQDPPLPSIQLPKIHSGRNPLSILSALGLLASPFTSRMEHKQKGSSTAVIFNGLHAKDGSEGSPRARAFIIQVCLNRTRISALLYAPNLQGVGAGLTQCPFHRPLLALVPTALWVVIWSQSYDWK